MSPSLCSSAHHPLWAMSTELLMRAPLASRAIMAVSLGKEVSILASHPLATSAAQLWRQVKQPPTLPEPYQEVSPH